MDRNQIASALVSAGISRTMSDAGAMLDDYLTDEEYEGSWHV